MSPSEASPNLSLRIATSMTCARRTRNETPYCPHASEIRAEPANQAGACDWSALPRIWAYALPETKGRKTGKPRRTPVGYGCIGNQCWLVAEHGTKAGYVRNIERDPHVRLKLR